MNAPQPRGEVLVEIEGVGISATSDPQARYVLNALPRDEHLAMLYFRRPPLPAGMMLARPYSLERPDGRQRVSLLESRELDLVAAPRASIFGVLRVEGGAPDEHGGVGIFIANRPGYNTLSAPDGSFELSGFPIRSPGEEEPLRLEFRAAGYAPLSFPIEGLRPFALNFITPSI